VTRFHGNHEGGTSQPMSSVIPKVFFLSREPTMFPVEKDSLFDEHLNTSKFKEPMISVPEKFSWYMFKVSKISQSNSTYYISSTSILLNR